MKLQYLFKTSIVLFISCLAFGQTEIFNDKFRQLEEWLPTPNAYRTASGAPGYKYWQQRASYSMKLTLNDETQSLTGNEIITYTNNSTDSLRYLWLQLDQNRFEKDSDGNLTSTAPNMTRGSFRSLKYQKIIDSFDPGFKIDAIKDAKGKAMKYTIVKTMMRIDLDSALAPGATMKFSVDWHFHIVDQKLLGGRGGYEYFKDDGNYLYEIAQFFPRMAAYTDVNGWQHKQFLGAGEFTVDFGNYDVEITVPADHIVASTGVLQNPKKVLTSTQRKRLKKPRLLIVL